MSKTNHLQEGPFGLVGETGPEKSTTPKIHLLGMWPMRPRGHGLGETSGKSILLCGDSKEACYLSSWLE